MKHIAAFLIVTATALSAQTSAPRVSDYPIQPVPLKNVRVTDAFWQPRMEINRTVSIPHILKQNEITTRISNFLKTAKKLPGAYEGQRYNDTDVYKVLEAASFSLVSHPDPALAKQIDDVIEIIAAAQAPDGYLYNPRQVDPTKPAQGAGPERWTWEFVSHETYDMGHMIEAAVAHYQATGKRNFLTIAIKAADLISATFGPNGRKDAPGHEEVELALVKLFRVTGTRKYLDTSKFFLDQRGAAHTSPPPVFPQGDRFFAYNDLGYRQDATPVLEQTRAVGHAVRATYLFSAMTDAAVMLGDTALAKVTDLLFSDVTSKRVYITGGLGSVGSTEAFGADYSLPNLSAYTETCASIGGMLWYHRLFQRTGDAAALDMFERTLYNGYLSGVSIAGDTFFYQNPLESNGGNRSQRSAYFDVACCPANLARLMAQLPGLIYSTRGNELFVNLYIGSDATTTLGARTVKIAQKTDYPWRGDIALAVNPDQAATFTVSVRIPGWSHESVVPSDLYRFASAAAENPTVSVNGTPVTLTLEQGFVKIRRRWQKGDRIAITLPMPVRRVLAHDKVADNVGKAAIERGPLVYCLEAADNGAAIGTLTLPLATPLSHEYRAELLKGLEVITGKIGGQAMTAIPYFAWANRGRGEMRVWIPQ
ncbi:MAG: beta-L-arabinofuranosidase domain-containing protein [Acidobacteriota bacterium]